VHLGHGVTVNRGCVLQTHLFHDRLMRVDGVRLDAGASLGPNSVILPGASLGVRASVGAASLVMRGEAVPARSRWSGNALTAEAGVSAPFVADRSRTVAMRLVTPVAKSQKAA
jgi:non-ribosomal peptide synthetase-like protein